MASFDPLLHFKDILPESIRVKPPTVVLFLCGGLMSKDSATPNCLRDAFFKLAPTNNYQHSIILAENLDPTDAEAGYKDLLAFESDIAQVVSLIVLFVESAGSIAELGAFSAIPKIAENLLVFIDKQFYDPPGGSFIYRGPILSLKNNHNREQIAVIDYDDLKITKNRELHNLDNDAFYEIVTSAIQERLLTKQHYRALSSIPTNGEAILLMTGLCQEFGALQQREVVQMMNVLKVADFNFDQAVYCAKQLNWLQEIPKSNNTYYVPKKVDPALDYSFQAATAIRDKIRWRAHIAELIEQTDKRRFNAIQSGE